MSYPKWIRCTACNKRVLRRDCWEVVAPEGGPEADSPSGDFCSWACVAVTCGGQPQ